MRHSIIVPLCATAILTLAACDKSGDAQVQRALQDLNVVDESNLNDVMLTVGDPDEAVKYFSGAVANDPGRIDDAFYEIAVGLTTTPAAVYNNWGYSKLSRGDYGEAERLFGEALRRDTSMFTAKNNMVLARGAQRRYDLPVFPMSQIERAQLLHTMALTAIKQNDVTTGKGLLREAIDTHPQHFAEAVRSLRALEANVTN